MFLSNPNHVSSDERRPISSANMFLNIILTVFPLMRAAVPFVSVIAHFLYSYVVETADPLAVFVAGSVVIFCTYHVLDHVLILFSERYQVRHWTAKHGAVIYCSEYHA